LLSILQKYFGRTFGARSISIFPEAPIEK